MGQHVITNGVIYLGSHDLTGEANEVRLAMAAAAKNCTTFGSGGSEEYKAGLKTGDLEIATYWQAGADTVDEYAAANLGVMDQVASWTQTGVAGDACYFGRFGKVAYKLGGTIGEMAASRLTGKNSQGQGVVRGLLAAAKQSKSATGQLGSILNLGAPSASQYVYAILHTFGTAGTSITVQVQSDDAAGFSSPTTRGTIGPVTTATGTWLARVAGPFSGETHWRLNISAITGTWTVAGAIAVQ